MQGVEGVEELLLGALLLGEELNIIDQQDVDGVARIQLRSAIPVESRLRGMAGGREARGEAAIVAKRRGSRVILGGHELHFLEFHAQVVDGFLDEIGILVANVAELGRGYANKQNAIAG